MGSIDLASRRRRTGAIEQLEAGIARITHALARVLLQAVVQETARCVRCGRRQRAPIGLASDHRRQRVAEVVAGEGALAGEHLVDHATERPEVGAPVDRHPASLFRRHVGRRPEQHSHLGRRGGERKRRRL
jgi:hypothetical protein